MRERRKLRAMAALVAVQRARRSAAEDAMNAARQREEAARAEESKAADRSALAQAQWLEFVSRAGFSPEYSRVLADRLIESADQSELAARRTQSAAELHERRTADWRRLEAQDRSAARSLQKLRRHAERRDEERRLSALADRISFGATRS